MITQIFTISIYLATLSSVVLLIFSFLYCYRKNNPAYLRIFPSYCVMSLIAEILNNYWLLEDYLAPSKKLSILSNMYTCYELIFFTYFLILIIHSKLAKKILVILDICFFLFCGWTFVTRGLYSGAGPIILFECLILIIPCLVYFRELFTLQKHIDLSKEPSFWIVTAMLFYYFIFPPIVLFNGYFELHKLDAIALGIESLNNFSQIITDILFIKAFTCRVGLFRNQPGL